MVILSVRSLSVRCVVGIIVVSSGDALGHTEYSFCLYESVSSAGECTQGPSRGLGGRTVVKRNSSQKKRDKEHSRSFLGESNTSLYSVG